MPPNNTSAITQRNPVERRRGGGATIGAGITLLGARREEDGGSLSGGDGKASGWLT